MGTLSLKTHVHALQWFFTSLAYNENCKNHAIDWRMECNYDVYKHVENKYNVYGIVTCVQIAGFVGKSIVRESRRTYWSSQCGADDGAMWHSRNAIVGAHPLPFDRVPVYVPYYSVAPSDPIIAVDFQCLLFFARTRHVCSVLFYLVV